MSNLGMPHTRPRMSDVFTKTPQHYRHHSNVEAEIYLHTAPQEFNILSTRGPWKPICSSDHCEDEPALKLMTPVKLIFFHCRQWISIICVQVQEVRGSPSPNNTHYQGITPSQSSKVTQVTAIQGPQ